jgi:hypothetical protein
MINSQAYRIVTWQPVIEKAPLSTTTGRVVGWTMGIITSKPGWFEDDTYQNML